MSLDTRWSIGAGVRASAALAFLSAGFASAQGPCVEAPLFSGNVALHMPLKPENPDVPLHSRSLAVGDFDNDGDLDLIHGTYIGSLVYSRCRGDWWDFDPPVVTNLPFAQPPSGMNWEIGALAAADLNADGKLDLVAGDAPGGFVPPTPQRIHVMLGNGDGTFQAATAWGPPLIGGIGDIRGVGDLDVRDFNGDSKPDIAYGADGGATPDTVGVLWGTGAGSFPTFTVIYTGGAPTPTTYAPPQLDAADIEGDGDQDVVAGVATGTTPVILRNTGTGTFGIEPLSAVPSGSFGYTFGELNGDGRPDLVCATQRPNPAKVWVLLNDGTGQFPTATGYWVTTQPTHTDTDATPLAADLDEDGRAEVVIGREGLYSGSGYFEDQTLVFHNAGDGTLEATPALYHHVGGFKPAYTAADLNEDGHEDVIAFNWTTTTLMVNDGEGGFLTARGTPMGPTIPPNPVPGMNSFQYLTEDDVNNDGLFDLVGVRQAVATPFLEITVMLQDQQGWFTTLITSVPLPERATFLALADFDRDGNLDTAVTTTDPVAPCSGDAVRVALGNGDGTFDPLILYHSAGNDPVHLAAADLNGDTWPDLAVTTRKGPNCQGPHGVSVLLNNKDGTFPTSAHYTSGDEPQFIAVANLNADTHPDLAVLTYPAGVTILLNDGDGTFAPHGPCFAPYGIGYTQPIQRPLVLADANGDGNPDMFVSRDYYPTLSANSGGIHVLLNDGSAGFQSVGVVGARSLADWVETADLNSDGNLDLITLSGGVHPGRISAFAGNGNGTFGAPVSYGGGGQGPIVVEDFDQDGHPDLGSPMGCSPDSDLADHVGFARLYNRTCPACYPDCNDSGSLTVADFTCFQSRFVAGDPYADCNQTGTLTVADFTCFQSKFVAGCP